VWVVFLMFCFVSGVDAADLIEKCLSVEASKRPTLDQVLNHRWTCAAGFPFFEFETVLSWWRHRFLCSTSAYPWLNCCKRRLRYQTFYEYLSVTDLMIHATALVDAVKLFVVFYTKARSYASYVLYFLNHTQRTYYNVLYFIILVHIFGRKIQGLHYNNTVN